jgi:hypothetical protein
MEVSPNNKQSKINSLKSKFENNENNEEPILEINSPTSPKTTITDNVTHSHLIFSRKK